MLTLKIDEDFGFEFWADTELRSALHVRSSRIIFDRGVLDDGGDLYRYFRDDELVARVETGKMGMIQSIEIDESLTEMPNVRAGLDNLE